MIRFRDLRLRTKLGLTFGLVLLPLFAAAGLAVYSFRQSLRESAELNLTNVVDHLWRLCEAQHRRAVAAGVPDGAGPRPEDIADLRNVIRSFQVGRTGYAYAMDQSGLLLIHPELEGQIILDSRDSSGFAFIRAIVERAPRLAPGEVGAIRYPWQSPEAGDREPRTKILKYRWFGPWGWVLAAGSYEEEIYAAVGKVELYTLPLVLASIVLVVVLTLALTGWITRPLRQISSVAARMADGHLGERVPVRSGDELGDLARWFNTMADEISAKTGQLEQLVDARTRELRESRESYRNLVESMVHAVVTTDTKGTVTFVNRGLVAMLGYSPEELLGREVWRFYSEGKQQAQRLRRELREQGHVTNFELSLIGKDRTVPIRVSASVLRDADGRERGTLGVFSDLTQQKRLEAELRQAQARLVQSMKLRALGDLVAGVAHEINNPLMASTTMLHVLTQSVPPADADTRRRLDVLARCNERIARIVDHLREFSRQSQMELRPLDVALPLENALLITGQQLLNHRIEIRRELEAGLPRVQGDTNYLEQVFLNLIANARDAMDAKGGEKILGIRVARATLDGKPAVAVTISDTGPGIPNEIREKIFEPFFTTKEVGRGTGLGLSIAYGIVEQHGGRIELETEPGKGAAFRIVIPACAPADGGGPKEGGAS